MSGSKFIARADIPAWLKELSSSYEVFAPRVEGQTKPGAGGATAVVYRLYTPEAGIELDKKPTESAKHAIFPRSEALLTYHRVKKPENPGQTDLILKEPADPAPRLVFGLLSCDARGFLVFDPVYDGCGTGGKAKDPYYLKRRDNTVLIVRACDKVLSSCFCHWVGGGPASTEGADVLATEVADGFLLEPVSERGAKTLESKLLKDGSDKEAAAKTAHEAATKALGEAPDLGKAPEALLARFDDATFWRDESGHCISCGACTYLCPTCYCFSITDEGAGLNGVRARNWDACMTPLFTLEASGHNPRTGKAQRLRNRVGHKFSYYPGIHNGRIACCGCGRCIKSCPSSVDIRRIVTDAINAKDSKEAGK